MDQIKRFLDCYIPTETCNLRCHYCYIAQQRKFENVLASFPQSKETIRAALSKERLGGPCLMNFCAGGETLLSDELLPIVRELVAEGHYAMIVTNGTITKRFEEIASWPAELLQRLFIKFSFHYLEMKRLGWMDRFFDNVNRMKQCGASFTVEITPSDEMIPYIEEVKDTCMQYLGTLCHITVGRDDRTDGIDLLSKHDVDTYQKIWGQFGSELFDFKMKIFHQQRKEFCYAGQWSAYINLVTGDMRQCYCGKELDNIYKDVTKPLRFEPVGCGCSLAYCYNGPAFLSLGYIPELEAPTYAETRNRVCADGSQWLSPAMKAFMSTRLKESNREFTEKEKNAVKRKMELKQQLLKCRHALGRIKRRIIR